ncbi:MAG: histidinol dehydrogenase, partial [Rhodospirillales bacterium 12-54-5]
MPHRLSSSAPDFLVQLKTTLSTRYGEGADVSATVRDILRHVRSEGDKAVVDYTQKFDQWEANTASIRMSAAEIDAAASACAPEVRAALKIAAERIRAYHDIQKPADHRYTDPQGFTLGWKYAAIHAVGLYVPGGKASYPSSVLMNAIPARVAGVSRIAMVVPTPRGEVNAAVFAAAQIAGVDEIYRMGGAQAVGALAYGTQSISPVDKIVGPGNQYVAEAKRQVFGVVGIDTITGPSEILVVADAKNNPRTIAADLLSQSEHDETAQSILITNDAAFAATVEQEIAAILPTLSKHAIARTAWENHGIIITVTTWNEVVPAIDLIAPEHLELAVDNPDAIAEKVRFAGAIFLGRHTPEAVGDYVAGPSHVLPTSRAA